MEEEIIIDGQEALDLFLDASQAGKPYTFVFMDIEIPLMNGLSVTKAIREHEETAIGFGHTYITALTSNAEKRRECFSAGMDSFLSKPVNKKHIKKVLEKASLNST